MNNYNIILDTDSYKLSHWVQYPQNTKYIFSYLEARGGYSDNVVFFGLQYYLKEYLSKPITMDNIVEADEFAYEHGVPFNRSGWEYILNKHDGYLPVEINSVKEGSVIPIRNCLLTIQNTDPECYWLPSHLETSLLRSCWYGTTVATTSWNIKQLIKNYMERTCDTMDGLDYKLHDFGARGVSSYESAAIGGAAHLINFKGTDTITGIRLLQKYYNASGMPGISVPASEHSSITSWGRSNEVSAYRNMIDQFGKPGKVFSVVSDSYDIFNACSNIWGSELKQEVIDSGATLVIRPDSGDPTEVVLKCLDVLSDKFGFTTNTKGYKVLNYVRVLQGDGICYEEIASILATITKAGFSTDNVFFGMGGKLLQGVNRDTHEWAIKCSAAMINDEWVDVYKQPIGSSMKASKRGRISLYQTDSGDIKTLPKYTPNSGVDLLEQVYINGNIMVDLTLDEIRQTSMQ